MKLFTKEIDTKLFEQYLTGSDLENQMVVAKIFNPYGRGTWYLLNSDPEDPEYLWAIVDMDDIEVGSVNRSDLENIRIKPFMLGLERDLSFRQMNALELYEGLNEGKKYIKGGGVEIKVIEDFAKGGGVKYCNKENEYRLGRTSSSIEKEILNKVTFQNAISEKYFVGSFGWKNTQGKYADGYLYKLDDFDQDLTKDLKLKSGEKIFRYVNRTTAIGGMTPFIKINLEKSLLYFPIYSDNDDILFVSRGVNPLFINIIEDKMAHGGGVENENKEMVLNNNKQIAHHTKELQSALKGKKVPAWVVAKVNRSASDLSDATHYMEGQGESYADGGAIYKHKHMNATAKILEKTNKGYKVEFTDNSVRKPKAKIMYFNDIDFDKDKGYFEKMETGGGVKYIPYKDEEIMHEPSENKYYANDEEFDTLKEAQNYIDRGSPMSAQTINAYRHGAFKDGGVVEEKWQIKDSNDKYFSVSMQTGKPVWNESPDLGYSYEKQEAEKIKDKLVELGNKDLEVVEYNPNWWKMETGGGVGKLTGWKHRKK